MTLLCLSVAAARSNLVVVTASVKGYPEPMTVLIDSGASFNFATKASVARNSALYASALEASKSNTNVSVRLATGSIVSTRKVTIPLSVKFDDFNSVEPFIVLDMDCNGARIGQCPFQGKGMFSDVDHTGQCGPQELSVTHHDRYCVQVVLI
ncbi:hypothetical protein PF008_g25675 [Phytophthora fragariae]|uniref:Peptidase A2 domain-containing protein n=1 Tax=Phytophthora fragariae TaxID=53985 RepID=A0A6G0QJ83_9STRA|nr:hypothetical protein PF008_g25675 [Phytophthora fragariae]